MKCFACGTSVTVQKTTMMEEEESKYLHEATALEKLVSPSNTKSAEENKTISEETPLKVPDNNPFRKRKLAELQVEAENVAEPEPVSAVTEVGDSEMCATPESQESVDSKPIKAMMDGKERAKRVKLEGSDRRSLNCKKGSILNFFSRV